MIAEDSPLADELSPLERARRGIREAGFWSPRQQMGRRWPIGCVALEITQRCNLDCTACYLSETSEALHDLPLEEVFRRIEAIRASYDAGTDVQITGGDPTLRKRAELIAIVRRTSDAGLRSTLFTNGIRATRALLSELADAGLSGVAFHVDLTQRRRGYRSEIELNALREEYIARARGLPLAVYFNTTVHAGNFREIPEVVRFFLRHGGAVSLVSFQLQAATGRGVLGARSPDISLASAAEGIRLGAGVALNFDAMDIGHPCCNRLAMALMANGRVYDLLDDAGLVCEVLECTALVRLDSVRSWRTLAALAASLARRPVLLLRCLAWAVHKAWRMRWDLLLACGRVHKLSFFIHNFMDAGSLDAGRIGACSFMAMTADGPLSMCAHNALRDRYTLRPVAVRDRVRVQFWDPATGRMHDQPVVSPVVLTRKTARGRARKGLA